MDGAVGIFTNVSLEHLVSVLCYELDYDELIEFIRELDSSVADSEFTNRLISLARELKAELEEDE